MARFQTADLALLYHLNSSNERARTVDLSLDLDQQPLRFRTYPAAVRTPLPGRDFSLSAPIGDVLERRRSVRDFVLEALPLEVLGRLLHTSYGVRGHREIDGEWTYDRPAPSAGGRYPLELYIAAQRVTGLEDGLYHYDARAHELELRRSGAVHDALASMTIGQDMLRTANLVVCITAVRERTMWKYGQRGYRYVWLDAGHVGQNLYLVATALGLGAVAIGGFFDSELQRLLDLPEDELVMYVLCVGHPRPA